MFSYKQYHPSPQLAELIECYWTLQAGGGDKHIHDRLIPGGRVELMFNFATPLQWLVNQDFSGGNYMSNAFIMGQRSKVFYAKSIGDEKMIGVRFKPGGLSAFTNVPAHELLNNVIPAENILGNRVHEWVTLLEEQENWVTKIALLDKLLRQAIMKIPADHTIMQYAVTTIKNGETSIQTICNETGWYYKKLERLFLRSAGYTPKQYAKITRFNKALRLMHGPESLTRVCYECNYFDQSHFIKDFHELAGTSPKQFRKEDNEIASLLIKHQPV